MSNFQPAADQIPASNSSLLESLVIIAKAHGIAATSNSLAAGLPILANQLTPKVFARAAKRANLTSQWVERDLVSLNTALFPLILLLENNQTCVLLSLEQSQAKVVFPELPDSAVMLSTSELASRYSGRAVYVRPMERFDARTADVVKKHQGHWFWQVIADYKYLYRDVLLTALLINIFALAAPLFTMSIYDRVVPNQATDTLWVLSIGMLIAISADLVLRMMRAWFVELAASRMDVTLSATIMERVLGMRLSHRPQSVGSFAAGLQSFESIRQFVSSATLLALVDLPFVLIFFAVICLISWPLIFPILLGVLVMVIYTAAVQKKMHQLSDESMQAGAQRNAVLIESLSSMETLKTLVAESRMQSIWEKSVLIASHIGVKMRLLSNSVTTGTLWLQQFILILVMIAGVYLIVNGHLTQGGLIACYMLASRIMSPVAQTAGLMMQYHSAATALASLNQIMEKPVERPVASQWISRPQFQGAIEFKNVNFRYAEEDRDVLRSISFSIQPGEHVAILGRNGSGKTTLEKLIAGLYDNIAMGMPQASDEQILEAVRLSGLTDFVNQHPLGLAMPVGEHGKLLSGGQRQSVTLARALLIDPPILLMDEPTGSMDHTSEEECKKRIAEFAVGKTLVVITHRTSLLELVNRIIVMDAGKIVADGPKDQVVEALRQGRIGRAS
ncbi:MAG: type I secretion system permease/ATPase [Cellvibrio sp.]|nr:type I secretion system permease/ATPase [Cellvibrio sp.]